MIDGIPQDYKSITIRAYDTIAKTYKRQNRESNFWENQFEELLGFLTESEHDPSKISLLDLGCGTARDAGMISSSGMQYLGVDLSEGMLQVARERNPGWRFLKMDVTQLDFEDDRFDVVWASAILLHLSENDLEKAMKEISRVLRDGGHFFVALESHKSGNKTEMKRSVKDGKEIHRFFTRYSEGEFVKTLVKYNFVVLKEGLHEEDVGEEGVAGRKTWLYYISRRG